MGKKTTFLKAFSLFLFLGVFSSLLAFQENEFFGFKMFAPRLEEIKKENAGNTEEFYPETPSQSTVEPPALKLEDHSKSPDCDNDTEPPVITAPAAVLANTDPGSCTATEILLGSPSTSDNCEVGTPTNDAPISFPIGTTTVTWTVTDKAENTATATQEVIVSDDEAPTITAPTEVSVTTDPGSCTATSVALGTPTTADNCEVDSVTNNAPSSFPTGITTVTWKVTDKAGNSATATQKVTVSDGEAPTITTPSNLVVDTDTGSCTATSVNLGTPTANDNCGVSSIEHNAPSVFPLGTTTVTWTASDDAGNTTTTSQTVTVEDNEDPVVRTSDISISLDTTGKASINTSDIDNGSTDNCGISSYSLSKTSFGCSDLGDNNVTLTVTDNKGNSASKIAVVTVKDETVPTVQTQNITIELDASGNATIAEDAVNNGSTDACGSLTFDTDKTAFGCNDIGQNTVTLTVTDASNNSASKTAVVTVQDKIAPIVETTNIIVQLDASGKATIEEDAVNNGSTDACGGLTFNTDKTTFDCTDIGQNTVTLTVTDANDNIASKTAVVTVEDNVAPGVLTQNITVQLDASGKATISDDAVNNGSTDACGTLTFNTSKTGFDCTNIGENTVILTVTDPEGNSSTGEAVVTVEDNIAPTVQTQNITIHLDSSGKATIEEDAVNNGSTDACGGLAFNTDKTIFDCTNIGQNTVTLTVTDANDNAASKTAVVTVEDNVAPGVLTQNITVQLDASGKATISDDAVNNGSTDACGTLTYNTSKTDFDCTNIGENTVILTVTDPEGNSSTGEAVVTVEDNIAPTVQTQNITIQLDASGNATIAEDAVNNGSSDACGQLKFNTDKTTFNCQDLGENTVTLTVTDANNNTASHTAVVTVEDKIAPTVQTKNITVELDASGNATIAEDAVNNGSTDACGTLSFSTSKTDFNCSNVGANTVTLTVTDAQGNSATKDAVVTVVDNQIPVISSVTTITAETDPGKCSASVSIPLPSVSNNCEAPVPTGTRSDGKALNAPYPLGDTVITWSATDSSNNTAVEVKQTVTVEDKEAPALPHLQTIVWGCEYTVSPPTAIDNCEGQITATGDRDFVFSTSGSITWTFTDSKGNSSSVTQDVTINQIQVEVDTQDILCNGFATGEAEAIVTGGIAPFTYDWAELGSGSLKDGLSPGNYGVTVTDVNGCTASTTFEITEPDSYIEITNVNINKGCFGENNARISFTPIGGTAPYQYYLNDIEVPETTIENLAPGTYTIKVVDDNNCTQEKTITINEPEKLVITNIVATETNTFGSSTGTATVILEGGTPNYTFNWSNGQTTQVATGLAAGEYSVVVTDANGCTATRSVTVIDPLEAHMLPVSKCLSDDGGLRTSTFEVEHVQGGVAPYRYDWDFGGETESGVRTAEGPGIHVVDYREKGTYTITLTVTDSAGNQYVEVLDYYVGECFEACGQTSNLDFVDSFYVGKEDGTVLTSSECENYAGKVYIYLKVEKNANAYNPSVEFIYTIYNPQNQELISEERITGCVPMEGDGKIPEIFRIGEVNNWTCGYAINLENFYMDWTNGKQKPCGDVRQKMCVSTNEHDEIHFPLAATVNVTHIFCNGSEEGVIKVNASGGVGAYTYELTNTRTGEKITQSSFLFENLPAGVYDVIVRDNNDIFTRRNIEITQPANPLILEEIDKTPLICHGGNDATATVRASGGTAPYTIVWDHISQTSTADTGTATNLSAGSYTVRVVDNNGCEFFTEVEIDEPPLSIADAGTDQELGCGVEKVVLKAVFEDYTNPATGELEFGKWTVVNGPSGSAFSNVNDPDALFSITTTGTYTLRWTVPCGAYDDVKITFRNCSTIDFDGRDDHIDFGNNYNLTGDFTLEAWIKPKTSSGGIKTIISKRYISTSAEGGYDLVIENNIPKFRWNGSSLTSDYPIDTDRWYHIAIVKGGADEGMYIDGIKVADGTPGAPNPSTSPFLIGAAYESSSSLLPQNFFHGWIEEVRIWGTALNLTQLRFMMNQRIKNNGKVRGETLPLDVPDDLNWSSLNAYYRLMTAEAISGITKNRIENGIHGRLKNIQSTQDNTAPLPYFSGSDGTWDGNSWAEWEVWDAPNSTGVDGVTKIDWNIAKIDHNISSGSRDIMLLGLLSEKGMLSISKNGNKANEYDPGQSLRITDYLKINGTIDLVGESQLLQDEGSILAENSSGKIERDQQGTASSYNYNYWSSPVAPQGATNNSPYTVKGVLRDGTNPSSPGPLDFKYQYHFADYSYTGRKRISSYWLHIYTNNTSNTYSNWQYVGETGSIKAGEGFSMKGTMGWKEITDRQNYTFIGKPNNGTIKLRVDAGNDYLIGNPYPSAIDSKKFILDNLKDSEGNNDRNIFNGTLYFWDHFSGKTHYLQEYVGGYAALNLSGGTAAVSTDERINATGEKSDPELKPLQYVPVGQAFYVSTQLGSGIEKLAEISGGEIIFRNSQRVFETDDQPEDRSIFKSGAGQKSKVSSDTRQKIYLKYISPAGYNRQILVTRDSVTTTGFDLGYDAPMIDNNKEDMYWTINKVPFVIQGVPDFNQDRVLPLGLKAKITGEATIAIDELLNIPNDLAIYLKDSLTGQFHDLRSSSFKTTAQPGTIDDRFSIVFQKEQEEAGEDEDQETPGEDEGDEDNGEGDEGSGEKPGTGSGTDGENEKPEGNQPVPGDLQAFYLNKDGLLVIKNPELLSIQKGSLYNVLGQKISEFRSIPAQARFEIPVQLNTNGVYIFNLETNSGSKSVKFIVE